MPTPRLVLFDLVGTLLRVESEASPYWLSIGNALSRAGLCDAQSFTSRYASFRPKWHASEIETPLRERLAEFADVPREMCSEFEQEFVRNYAKRSSVIGGVDAMLAAWTSVSTLGVVSNFFIAGAPAQLLKYHDLLKYFAFVVDSAEAGWRKPSRAIFELAINRCEGFAPQLHEVLMIGDTWRTDIEGARSMGLNAAYFSPAGGDRAEVQVVQSWDTFRPAAAASVSR